MVEKDDLGSRELSELQMRASINAKLIETGERDKLRLMLQQKLIECGWKDQVKKIVRNKGLDNISVEELVAEMVPKSRQLVPDPIKKELLQRIRTFLSEQTDQ